MNKFLLAVCMIITAVAVIGVILIMVMGMNGYSLFDWPGWPFNLKIESGMGGDTMLIKEETLSMRDIQKFTLEAGSFGVHVRAVDGDDAVVRQYSNRDDESFTVSNNGSEIFVDVKPSGVHVGIFLFVRYERRVEIDIPRGWLGSVNLRTNSGGIKLQDEFQWDGVSLGVSSGGIELQYPLSAKSLSIEASSGGIHINSGLTIEESIYIRTSSGGIRASGQISADSLEVSASSGGINMGDAGIAVRALNASTSSGGLTFGTVSSETFRLRATSGSVKFEKLTGSGEMSCSSGGIRVEMLEATGAVDAHVTSGGIRVGLPGSLSFNLDARTTSGSVKSDFPMNFRNDRHKEGECSNGDGPRVNIKLKSSSGGITVTQV